MASTQLREDGQTGPVTPAVDAQCSIERTVAIVGDRWSLLILREILTRSATRFSELSEVLGISANILTNRLETLTRLGILERREYKEDGSRPRPSYHPTKAGRELTLVLAALGQWGDDHVPSPAGIAQTRQLASSGQAVRVGFVTDPQVLAPLDDVTFEYTDDADPAFVASDPRHREKKS